MSQGIVMQKSERQSEIYAFLSEKGYASVEEISRAVYTSESSVRRDLDDMEKRHLVKRCWGGAEIIRSRTNVSSFSTRAHKRAAEKEIIAEKAVRYIKEGNIVFLDQSSTAFLLAQKLVDFKNLTVVTNNLEILVLLSETDIVLHSSGGIVSRKNPNCLVGNAAQKTFEGIFADVVFFSTHSLSDEGVLSDCTEEEIYVRNSMLKNSAKKIFLCDSSKFGTRSSFVQCTVSDVDEIISDIPLPEKFKKH